MPPLLPAPIPPDVDLGDALRGLSLLEAVFVLLATWLQDQPNHPDPTRDRELLGPVREVAELATAVAAGLPPAATGTTDPPVLGDAADAIEAIAAQAGQLPRPVAIYAVARGLAEGGERLLVAQWLATLPRDEPVAITANTPIVTGFPDLTGQQGPYTTHPSRNPGDPRGLPGISLPAIPAGMSVTVQRAGAAVTEALTAIDRVHAVLPNPSLTDLTIPAGADAFPTGPTHPDVQFATIASLLDHTPDGLVVLPELSVTADIVDRMAAAEDHREADAAYTNDTPRIIVAGSAHVTDGPHRRNRSTTVVGARRTTHDKVQPWDDYGRDEGIDPGDTVVAVLIGDHVRLATLICKDVLREDLLAICASLGLTHLAVPAMSAKTLLFDQAALRLVAARQTVVVVANGPTDLVANDQYVAMVARPNRTTVQVKLDVAAAPGDPAVWTYDLHTGEADVSAAGHTATEV